MSKTHLSCETAIKGDFGEEGADADPRKATRVWFGQESKW